MNTDLNHFICLPWGRGARPGLRVFTVLAGGLQLLDAGMGMAASSSGAFELEDDPASAFSMGPSGTRAEEYEDPSDEVKSSIKEIGCSISIDCKEKHAPHEYIFRNLKFSEL